MSRLISYKNLFFLAVLVGIVLIAMRFTHVERSQLTPMEAAIKDALAPIQGGLMAVTETISKGGQSVMALGGMVRENKELREEIAELRGQLILLEELKQENQRLSDLVQYHDQYADNFSTRAARVIGRDPGNWFGIVTLNIGQRDGILKNMPVVTPLGLAGKVVAVSGNTAQVMLITDPRSGVGALVQETRVPGVLVGTTAGGGSARLIHVPKDTELAEGQVVLTSGVGGTFPKGIPIGRIVDVADEPTGLFKTATVQPFADLQRLEEALIITKIHNPDILPPTVGD